MSLDTKAKRFSMLNFGDVDALLPDPDGTIGQGDRQHLLSLYSGILAEEPVVPSIPIPEYIRRAPSATDAYLRRELTTVTNWPSLESLTLEEWAALTEEQLAHMGAGAGFIPSATIRRAPATPSATIRRC